MTIRCAQQALALLTGDIVNGTFSQFLPNCYMYILNYTSDDESRVATKPCHICYFAVCVKIKLNKLSLYYSSFN